MITTFLVAALLIAPLEPLHFLAGTWEAAGGAKEMQGAGKTTFEVVNQGHAMVRKNFASYPATPQRAAYRHDDLMVIYPDGSRVRADYFDSEGHIIHYTVTIASDGSAVFVSDVIANTPRYRLTYAPDAKTGTVQGKFEVASPATPETFAPYLAWSAHRTSD
jgi:hypothetical protein